MKGTDLKEFRIVNNLTQTELGDYLGVQKGFISKIENGKDKLPEPKYRKIIGNPFGWDTTMLTRLEVSQSSTGDNTIQVTGNNVDMRNINQSLAKDEKKVAELEKRVAELTKDKEMLQAMIEKLQAQMSKLLEMM
jgi:transcriptional regulator with XRE-family HTH domain